MNGYNAFGLPGNPQFLDVVKTVVGAPVASPEPGRRCRDDRAVQASPA